MFDVELKIPLKLSPMDLVFFFPLSGCHSSSSFLEFSTDCINCSEIIHFIIIILICKPHMKVRKWAMPIFSLQNIYLSREKKKYKLGSMGMDMGYENDMIQTWQQGISSKFWI